MNTAASTAASTMRSSPNQSLRCPSSSMYSRLPRPTAMQAMPAQSPRANRSSRIGCGSSPHQIIATSAMPGSRLM